MSTSLYARDPITKAYKELSASEVSPGVWGLIADVASAQSSPANQLVTYIDDLGTTLYVGKAALGASESAAVWQIFKMLTTGSVSGIRWPGDANFTHVWADRASLTYSS